MHVDHAANEVALIVCVRSRVHFRTVVEASGRVAVEVEIKRRRRAAFVVTAVHCAVVDGIYSMFTNDFLST